MKWLVSKILVSIFVLGSPVYGQMPPVEQPAVLNSKPKTHPKEQCKKTGGLWTILRNGCEGTCQSARSKEPPICTQALKEGCKCSEKDCWNGQSCEKI